MNNQMKISAMKDIFEGMGLDPANDVKILVQKAFDLDDEGTYGSLTCGKLAYEMIGDLLREHKLGERDIDNLMDKTYSMRVFDQVVYIGRNQRTPTD